MARVPVNEDDIPLLMEGDTVEEKSIAVLVDGSPARCFITSFPFIRTRIVFLFDDEHPDYGKEWGTKHFKFDGPGTLNWGHDGKQMEISRIDISDDGNRLVAEAVTYDDDDDYYDDDDDWDDGGSGRTPNDDRSDSMNPNSPRYNP